MNKNYIAWLIIAECTESTKLTSTEKVAVQKKIAERITENNNKYCINKDMIIRELAETTGLDYIKLTSKVESIFSKMEVIYEN